MVKFRLKEKIPLDAIDNKSDKYSLEYSNSDFDDIRLKEEHSIASAYGLLYPPVFVFESGRYVTTAGKRIIATYKKINKDVPSGLIIDRADDKYDFLKFLIHMKKECTDLNVIEKSNALKKCFCLRGKVEEEIAVLLGVPKNEMIIQHYIDLADASENIKILILSGKLHEYTAFEIFSFMKEEWDLLADFISALFLGTKKRNKIINMIYEISQREETGVKPIIETDEINDILNSIADPPHIGEKIFTCIEEMRYPAICKYRKSFYKQLKDVGFDKTMQFVVPRDFELREFKLTFAFSSAEDFNEQIMRLKKIGESGPFQKLMGVK